MSIEYSEVAASWPPSFEIGFGDVHDDGDAIFIIIFDESMEGIDSVAFDGSVGAFDKFDCFYSGYGVRFSVFLIHRIIFNDYFWIASV